jgi:hypothetical protein
MEPNVPTPPPRQRFPTGKQALVIFFGALALSFTTCMTVLLTLGERQLTPTQDFLVGLAVYICFFAPLGGFIVLMIYVVRRFRGALRQQS